MNCFHTQLSFDALDEYLCDSELHFSIETIIPIESFRSEREKMRKTKKAFSQQLKQKKYKILHSHNISVSKTHFFTKIKKSLTNKNALIKHQIMHYAGLLSESLGVNGISNAFLDRRKSHIL